MADDDASIAQHQLSDPVGRISVGGLGRCSAEDIRAAWVCATVTLAPPPYLSVGQRRGITSGPCFASSRSAIAASHALTLAGPSKNARSLKCSPPTRRPNPPWRTAAAS